MNPSSSQPDQGLTIAILSRQADPRGASVQFAGGVLEGLGKVRNCHASTIIPGAVRGNHAHRIQNEVIVVLHTDDWLLAWDSGPATDTRQRRFAGAGAVALAVPPGAAHALANCGRADLTVFALTDQPWDPQNPDVVVRQLISPDRARAESPGG